MKKGRETLLTLLEAFVYDPLVDWTVGGEGLAGTAFRGLAGNSVTRQNRKMLETEIALSMYNVRCTEIKVDWSNNKRKLFEDIPEAVKILTKYLALGDQAAENEDLLQDLHQQMALVKEAEAYRSGTHTLYTLLSRYESYCEIEDVVNKARKELDELRAESVAHIQAYEEALHVLDSHHYTQWIIELNNLDQINKRVFAVSNKFMQNAGQTNTVSQCESSEDNLEHLEQQLNIVMTKCLHSLEEYSSILAQSPPTFKNRHRMNLYLNWIEWLLKTQNSDTCEEVWKQLVAFTDVSKPSNAKSILEFEYHLSMQCNDIADLTTKRIDELTKLKETNGIIDQAYNNATVAVGAFLRCEKDAYSALKFMILSDLCKQNKDYLNLEITISRNTNVLLNMVSQKGGDWFLDDLIWYSNNAMELINYMVLNHNSYIEDSKFVHLVKGLQATNNLFNGLHDLYSSFHTIILMESMKKLLSEEESVIEMIGELNSLILSAGTPLGDLVTQLEKQLKCIVMEMDVSVSILFLLIT